MALSGPPLVAPARTEDARLGILYMIAAVSVFSIQNAFGKWLAQSYPIPMLVFFRSGLALLPCALIVWRTGGPRVMRTRRPGAQLVRALLWGVSNVTSFFAYHLLPIEDAVALTFAAPLFMTAFSWPMLREAVGRERWIAVVVGFAGVLIVARPSGGGDMLGILCAIVCALANAIATLAVRDLCRTETSIAIVTYTAIVITLLSVPVLPFFWVTPGPLDLVMMCAIGLMGGASQYWTTLALSYAPAAVVAPFNYTALVWGLIIGFAVWGETLTLPMALGSAIVTLSGLYLVRYETLRRARLRAAAGGPKPAA